MMKLQHNTHTFTVPKSQPNCRENKFHNKYTISITNKSISDITGGADSFVHTDSLYIKTFKVQQRRRLDHRGLVQVHRAVVGLLVAGAVGRLGVPHLALALAQLGHVPLEAQAELRVLAPGCFQPPLLQVDPLHVHHLLRRPRRGGGRFLPPWRHRTNN